MFGHCALHIYIHPRMESTRDMLIIRESLENRKWWTKPNDFITKHNFNFQTSHYESVNQEHWGPPKGQRFLGARKDIWLEGRQRKWNQPRIISQREIKIRRSRLARNLLCSPSLGLPSWLGIAAPGLPQPQCLALFVVAFCAGSCKRASCSRLSVRGIKFQLGSFFFFFLEKKSCLFLPGTHLSPKAEWI